MWNQVFLYSFITFTCNVVFVYNVVYILQYNNTFVLNNRRISTKFKPDFDTGNTTDCYVHVFPTLQLSCSTIIPAFYRSKLNV